MCVGGTTVLNNDRISLVECEHINVTKCNKIKTYFIYFENVNILHEGTKEHEQTTMCVYPPAHSLSTTGPRPQPV